MLLRKSPDWLNTYHTGLLNFKCLWPFCRWTLFLTLAVYASAVVVTALPSRLPRARFPLANLLSISSVLIMVSKLLLGCLHNSITHVILVN